MKIHCTLLYLDDRYNDSCHLFFAYDVAGTLFKHMCNFLVGAQTAIYLTLIDCFFIVVDETAKI